jgi:phosphate transport system substrate-binding protein
MERVGGADWHIVIGRERGSGTRDGFESITARTMLVLERSSLRTARSYPPSPAPPTHRVCLLSSLNGQENVVTLTIDGVACTEQTIRGSYRYGSLQLRHR